MGGNVLKNIFSKGINIISSLMVFGVNIVINLFLSPIIINNLGAEAYGYATLANNVAYYFSLIGLTLNSVGVRFVTIAWHNGDEEEARKYYSTILFFDIVIACVVLCCGMVFSLKLDSLFNVSEHYLNQAKIAFAFTFIASAISTITPVLNSGAYINDSIKNIYFYTIIAQIIKLVSVVILFYIDVKIYYVTIAAIISNLAIGVMLISYNKKKAPELKFGIRRISIDRLKNVAQSGIWILGDTVSSVLISGLSLVYANLMISETSMGLLSVATTISSQFLSLNQYIVQCYMPGMLESFSKNDFMRLKKNVQKSQKVTGIAVITPLAGVAIFGMAFFSLWLPQRTYEEIMIIQRLSVISLLPYIIFPITQSFRQINIVYNKVKIPTIISLSLGIIELLLVFVLGRMGKLNVYILASLTAIILGLKEIVANFVYSTVISKIKAKQSLLRMLLHSVLFLIISGTYYIINSMVGITSWFNFFITIIICGAIGYLVSFEFSRRLFNNI